jgi:mono/diheme cytochrome c family protein
MATSRKLTKKLSLGSLTLFAAALAGAASPARAEVDFEKQILPIFTASCFECHGPEKQKAKLRLDSPEAITKGSKEGPVLMSGDPAKSTLYTRVTLPADHDDIMPPSDEGKPLTKEQTDLIAAWITEGAKFGAWKGDPAAAAAGDHAGPAEIKLPEVAAADNAAIEAVRAKNALCMPLAQGVNLLDVGFTSGADKITDAELPLLTPLAQQIYSLNLAGTKVTDAGLAPLAGLTNLRRLHLEKTGITDAGLVHLKGLANLEYLNLYGTQVTDAGLANLEGLKNLKNVYLWQSKATDAGVAKLQAAIPACKIDTGWKEAAATPAAAPAPAPAEAPK